MRGKFSKVILNFSLASLKMPKRTKSTPCQTEWRVWYCQGNLAAAWRKLRTWPSKAEAICCMKTGVLLSGEWHLSSLRFFKRLQNGLLDGHDVHCRLLTHLNIINASQPPQTLQSKAYHIKRITSNSLSWSSIGILQGNQVESSR